MPDNALTDYQKKYYLSIFNKMMGALKEHGDRSQESEKYRKMLAPVMLKIFDYLWENI